MDPAVVLKDFQSIDSQRRTAITEAETIPQLPTPHRPIVSRIVEGSFQEAAGDSRS